MIFDYIPMMQYDFKPAYIEIINTSYSVCNGTYQSNDKYFNSIIVSEPYSDKEYVYDLYDNNKYFGKMELEAEEKIIERLSIPVKDNFLDYYE